MSEKKYYVAQFGTYDLPSLGDTMFPKIFQLEMKERFGDKIQIDLYSPSGTDHPYNDLDEVYSLDRLEENNTKHPYDLMVIGGGEFVHFAPVEYISVDNEKKVYSVGELWEKPQMIAQKLGIPVVWNCLGISRDFKTPEERKRIVESCKNLKYISVRDTFSASRLVSAHENVNVHMVADMLWLFNKHFSKDFLDKNLDNLKKENLFLDKGYILLQYGTSWKYEEIASTVAEIAKQKNLEVIAFVVNYCHEDLEIVQKMCEQHPEFHVFETKLSPIDIMSVIQNAKLFIGTSLHGNVTAMSYGVENICLDMYPQFVSKMDGIFAMLDMSERIAFSPVGLRERMERYLSADNNPKGDVKEKIGVIQRELGNHFDKLADIIVNHSYEDNHNVVEKPIVEEHAWAKAILKSGNKERVYALNIKDNCIDFCAEIEKGPNEKFEFTLFVDSCFALKSIRAKVNGIQVDAQICKNNLMYEEVSYFDGKCEFLVYDVPEESEKKKINVSLEILYGQDVTNVYNKLYIEKLEEEIYEKNCELKRVKGHLDYMLGKERTMSNVLEEKERRIQEKERRIQEKEQKIQEKSAMIRNKDGHIEQLLQIERDFENVKNSKFGRMMYAWWGFKDKLFPQGSKRRLLAKLLKKFMKHPIYMLKKCTPSRIARTLRYMRTENASMVAERLDAVMLGAGEDIERIPLELEPVVETRSSVAEYEKIVLPKTDKPLVSIIIPVYNQFHYTYNCLKSIVKNTEGIGYEVILADDCSNDLTASITEVVENIIIARTPENMRFLRNCNNAAKQARGEYIFFLNNDTQVLENWLGSLLKLIENDASVGMVGSKLLYPDGALQEAGGIVWKDASAWNLGNKRGPKEPEFNYVKEVDYISGAAIMIRHSLWKEIGGFDERFAPAYYEDTDLAMEVRAHGYKVVYQPLSMVVHFEGISNGTDTSSGQKEYQIVNQKKFYDKWKDVLKKEHFANGEEVFLAKDRSRFKKHILVVDHYVPKHDKDAGGKCTYMYLQLFVKLGMKVTFIGDNFYPEQPYTQELNQMGIEVLYGNYYYNNWKKWLKENAHYFDYIYLQRPHISIKYIDIVKEYSDAKILYFAHDLHHIREYREYELTGDEEKLKSSEKWKKIEYELFEKTDVGHVVGSYEQQVMQEAFPDKPIRNIPLYIYEKQLDDINKNFATREDIMYVGGFGHPPNIDAVLWFGKEVFPKVLEKYPTMKWYVIGSKVTPEIQALASDNIIIMGFVPDEKLDEVYRKCRMAIVPLRVGAGVKGKVVESAYYQIPLVTTTIGAEGLDDKVGNMVVEDNAEAMSELIIKLYEDYAALKDMSDAGRVFITRYFTENEAKRVVLEDIES